MKAWDIYGVPFGMGHIGEESHELTMSGEEGPTEGGGGGGLVWSLGFSGGEFVSIA